ncbi:MAG: hypothetical protein K2K13_03760 [Clostridiales bacterium]|nr:hypothetical protein [Clostridiales bacterium]
MKRSTKRTMRILWCFLAPAIFIGAVIYCSENYFDEQRIKAVLIVLGAGVVVNLPLCLA